jgi:hypothetical protein
MSPEPEFGSFLHSIVETLEKLELPYLIGGSVASSIYGEARSTRDVDISVSLPVDQVAGFVLAFEALDYYVFADAIIDAIIAHGAFNIIDGRTGYKVDIYVVDPNAPTPQEQEAFERKRKLVYDESTGAQAILYSPEDVIVYKLQYYVQGRMPKHLRDIAAMLVVQGDALDYDYVARWAEQIGGVEIWAELLAEYRSRQGK